jgi:hypothetical protein
MDWRRVARGQAEPTPVVQVPTPVTSCRHDAGPTVLDERGQDRARGSAADLGGDVVGPDEISMPLKPAVRAAAGDSASGPYPER